MDDLCALDVAELVDGFGQCRISPVDVLAACLERTARLDGALGIYLHLDERGAHAAAAASAERWRAGKPLSAIDGVPLALKANIAVRGWPHHAGVGAWRACVADEDAVCVQRLRAAGSVITGLVNMHEAAFGVTSDNEAFGRTRNPLDPDRVPGGSSGGSGAVVAAKFVPVALGSDTAGSVRIPASFTGTFGLKPAYVSVSRRGLLPLCIGYDAIGVHARSAASCAAVLDVIGDRRLPAGRALARLRLGVMQPHSSAPLRPHTAQALEATVGRLRAAGCSIVELPTPIDPMAVIRAIGPLSASDCAGLYPELLEEGAEISEALHIRLDEARRMPAGAIAAARARLDEMGDEVRTALGPVDAVLLPTTPDVAFRFDEPLPSPPVPSYTLIANVAGLPAIAIPVTRADGLPSSVQIMGWDDATVLAIAMTLDGDDQ
jgi:aspartyl-tRNA(Asn)/glutamyl-tRNA(Gln) amidotransferase subunit A